MWSLYSGGFMLDTNRIIYFYVLRIACGVHNSNVGIISLAESRYETSKIMRQTRGLGFVFLAHWTLLLHVQFAMPTPRKWVDTLPTFYHPDNGTFQRVVVDHNTGDVFVGAANFLFHFSSDLELKQSVRTGPLKDYPGCLIPPYPCSKPRVPSKNHVELLKLVYYFGKIPSLLLCGSVYNNLCQIRPTDNLEEHHWVHPFNETIGYTTNGDHNHAFFEHGYDGQMTLFAAAEDDKDTRKKQSAPYLSSKVLEKEGDRYYFRYLFQNESATSTVETKGRSGRYTVDDGFVHDNFIYFPVLYESPGIFSNNLESKLVRFCKTDPTLQSYAELPINCNCNGKKARIMTAQLGESPTSTGKALYTFSNDLKTGSAMCVFEMSSIVKAFTTWPRHCNPDIIGERCQNKKKTKIDDFCGSDVSLYIVSQTLQVEHFLFVPKLTIRVSTVVKQNGELVVFGGADTGELLKISMKAGEVIYHKYTSDRRIKTFVGYLVFDKEYKHIYLINRNKLIKYPVASCGAHETCHDCFEGGRKDSLKCGWCAGRCAQLEECADPDSFSLDTCTPTIYEVFPQKGPIQGSNTIKITGDNFGTDVNGAHISISVVGIPCNVSSWINTQVKCSLGSTKEVLSGPVQLRVFNTSSNLGHTVAGSAIGPSNFSYFVGPRIYGLFPGKGPTSGGTIVSLFGENFDFLKTKNRSIIVSGRLCAIKRFDENTAFCTTGNTSSTKFPTATAIHIDGVAYVVDKNPPSTLNLTGFSQSFEYTPDPDIIHIRPGITTLSGVMNLTVVGHHLDSVQFPKLVVKVAKNEIIGDSQFVEDCWIDPKSNGTMMTCRTPSLKNKVIFPTPTRTHPLVTQLSFVMDGVLRLRDLPKYREDLSRLLYYPDPVFRVFQETDIIKEDQTGLEIKVDEGINLELLLLADNLYVKIGSNESCKISRVSLDVLICDLPPSLFSNSSIRGTDISVEVITGSAIHHLGYIQFERPNEDNEVIWTSLLVIALIAIFLCVVFVAYKCFVRRRRNPTHKTNKVNLSNSYYRSVPTTVIATSSCSEYPSPDAGAKIPVAVVQSTVAVEQSPVADALSPGDIAQNPMAGAQSPVTGVLSPAAGVHSPVAGALSPKADALSPVAVVHSPVAVVQSPVTGVQNPMAGAQSPVTGVQSLVAGAQNPVDGALSSEVGELSPVAGAQSPVTGVQSIVAGAQNPGYGAHSPVVGVLSPLTGAQTPEANAQSPDTVMALVDNDTLFLLADKNLIISKRFLFIVAKIGSGHFGCVFEGHLQQSNQKEMTKVAVKTLKEHSWSDADTVNDFLREALIMKDFDHLNVLGLLGVCLEGSGPSIVLPFMENKDLYKYMINEDRKISKAELLKFAVDITAGMAYLERKRFLHRDLAARNCVLDSSLNAKVADFGLSRDIYRKNYYTQGSTAKIPYKWTAPESLREQLYTTKSDVWSYGVLLWEIMTRGCLPYSHVDNLDLLRYFERGSRLDKPKYSPLSLYKVMLACWNMDPSRRPTFHKLHYYVSRILEMMVNPETPPATEAHLATEAHPATEAVPAKHAVYHDSEGLYLCMEGRALDKTIFEVS